MLEFLFRTGWGAFTLMLLFQIPFLIAFLSIVRRKAYVSTGPSTTSPRTLSRLEVAWIGSTIALFIVVNLLSVRYMPHVVTAHAEEAAGPIQQLDITARSWGFDISEREVETGTPVRFSARSVDTMHSFTLYHPNGQILFTLQLLPGMKAPAETVYTFQHPGTYKVRCLEYCGIAHHAMLDEINVVERVAGKE